MTTMKTEFDGLFQAIRKHAEEEYPRESCGVISGGRYIPVENRAENPENDFRMPDDIMTRYSVAAVVHSHPDADDAPSEADMLSQIATAVPWGICSVTRDGAGRPWFWGNGIGVPDLIGRELRHGPSGSDGRGDCYALIRDFYRLERGIILPEFPRGDGWWERGQNLYAEHFSEAGFREIPAEEARDGDVFFMKILSSCENHAGILTGGGQLILHHLSGRLSRQEPLGRWKKFISRWVKYTG